MLAEAIRETNNPKPDRISIPNILQKGPNSDAVLTDVAKGAAENLGGKVTRVTPGVDAAGNHTVVIEITYPEK